MNKYQVNVKIYDDCKIVVSSKTFNGEICLILDKNKLYKLEYEFLGNKVFTSIFTNNNNYIFVLNNQNSIIRTITFSLKDYYYNIPIEKGEIILWQK